MHNRQIVPIGTEIECYPSWLSSGSDEMPVYTGAPEDAFIDLNPGMYPGSYMEPATAPEWLKTQVNVLLIVTGDESFAVTTDQSYTGPLRFEEPDQY